MTSARTYALHGLTVRSPDVPLDARPAQAGALPDVDYRLLAPGAVPAYGEHPSGRVMAALDLGPGARLTVVDRAANGATPADADTRFEAHFHGLATAFIDETASVVGLRFDPGCDPAFASVLLGGTVMSIVLTLRGHPVLHASAVAVPVEGGPAAIAFVGRSGMGKSTMATLLCRDGAELLGDDVLRTDLDGPTGVVAWPGATSTRLRPAAESLGRESAVQVATTADGRLSAVLRPAGSEAVPLCALVVPRPHRGTDAVRVDRVRGAAAVLLLASFPRVLGWTDPSTSGQAHRHWGELATRVPLMTVDVPWGPPFAAGLGGDVLAAVIEQARSAGGERTATR